MGLLNKLFSKKQQQSASIFWFNWREISNNGHSSYGVYVYQEMLPLFSPKRFDFSTGCYYFDDGDYLPRETVRLPFNNSAEQRVLEVVNKLHDVIYVVAIYNQGKELDLSDIDRNLQNTKVLGYIGMTSFKPGISMKKYLKVVRSMSLCSACDIRFGTFEKASFSFISDAELKYMGFDL